MTRSAAAEMLRKASVFLRREAKQAYQHASEVSDEASGVIFAIPKRIKRLEHKARIEAAGLTLFTPQKAGIHPCILQVDFQAPLHLNFELQLIVLLIVLLIVNLASRTSLGVVN